MLYIEQSLMPGEKVMHVGRFHWIYLVHACFWLGVGFAFFLFVIGAGVSWTVRVDIHQNFPGLPDNLFWDAWGRTVDAHGGYIAMMRDLNMGAKLIGFIGLLVGVAVFAQMMIIRATTEIAITTKRMVIKEGIVARRVDEMDIDRIESVHVSQSVLGRLLDYGVIMVRGMGVGEIRLPILAKPIVIRQAIEKSKYMNEAKDTW